MNFFEYQDKARRNSAALVGLFAFAICLLVIVTVLLAGLLTAYSSGQPFDVAAIGTLLGWDTIATIAGAIVGTIALGSLYKLNQLSAGGRVVAESLGGRKINLSPQSAAEERALNVVEEMAIASGTPVPDVYLIEDDAINAFAAGYHSSDAVVGLTRGAVEHLTRDELQGVVAHEFSHIFNGDMRLNIRIVGLLHGILIIGMIGYWLLRGSQFSSGRDNRGRAALLGIGGGLMVLGYTGTFFGNLIKSAVSRQREYLADASAVQFTRDQSGIAGALKKIGGHAYGSSFHAPQASEFSHMYFASGLRKSFTNLFATHPPLDQRIRRLDPDWNGYFPTPERLSTAQPGMAHAAAEQVIGIVGGSTLDDVIAHVDNSIASPDRKHIACGRKLLTAVPAPLREAAHDPFSARAIVYSLLLDASKSQRLAQRELLQANAHPGVIREMTRLEPHFAGMPRAARLALIDLCVPALKSLATQQYQVFKRNLIKLLRCSGTVEIWEWSLYRVLMHALEPRDHRQVNAYRKSARDSAIALLLAAMAYAGNREYLAANQAFEAGLAKANLGKVPLPSQTEVTLPRMDKATAVAASLQPLQKPALLKAMAATMAHDGVIEAEELELLRAIADCLDCPMPPIPSGTAASGTSVGEPEADAVTG